MFLVQALITKEMPLTHKLVKALEEKVEIRRHETILQALDNMLQQHNLPKTAPLDMDLVLEVEIQL